MSKVRLAIIGNGMAGHRFIKNPLDKSDAVNFDITVFCERPRIVYDHIYLSFYFSYHTAEELSLVRKGFHEKYGIKVLVDEHTITINRQEKMIHSNVGCIVFCGKLIMATGSYPWIPPIKGSDTQDRFVYHTIGDLSAIESCVRHSKRGAVVGGGLLGLETADVLKDLGIETHATGFAPTLMAEQFDQTGGEQLRRKIESMGVRVRTSRSTLEIVQEGVETCKTIRLVDDSELGVDFIVFSAGIRPCDKLAAQCGLDVAPHGGIAINDFCQTSDLDIYVISECIGWSNRVFGLVASDYKMAQVAVDHTLGSEGAFEGADLSIRLKLLGIDVDGIGDAYGCTPGARSYVYLDENKETYKRLIVSENNKTLFGAVLMDDTGGHGNLLQLVLNAVELPENLDSLILPACSGSSKPPIGVDKPPDSTQICSCFDVTKGDLIVAISKDCHAVTTLKAEAKTGTGRGDCIPLVTQVLNVELVKQGIEVNNNLCKHLAYSRQELSHLIRVEGIKTSEELLAKHDKGYGCEVCEPITGSLLISCWNEYILKPEHTPLQGPNDNFLVNIQRGGTYSTIPCSLNGEITPKGLVAAGRIVREFNLYTRIVDSQRPAMFGAWEGDLPKIWCQLIEAGLETGHAYVRALRMAKTCVGSTQYHYGVGDNAGLGVGLRNCCEGVRTPHKVKLGASGCTRERSEVQGKDVGTVTTEKSWSLYVCSNGGMKPCHADLLAVGIDHETPVRYLDRFVMFYTRAADKLTHTAPWLENLEGGIDCLKTVVIDDRLGLNIHLEEEIAHLCEAIVYEWAETINTPPAQTRLKHFIDNDRCGPNVQMVPGREQHHPVTSYERIPVALMEDSA